MLHRDGLIPSYCQDVGRKLQFLSSVLCQEGNWIRGDNLLEAVLSFLCRARADIKGKVVALLPCSHLVHSLVFKIKSTKRKQETGARVEAEFNFNLIRLRQPTILSVINVRLLSCLVNNEQKALLNIAVRDLVRRAQTLSCSTTEMQCLQAEGAIHCSTYIHLVMTQGLK